MEVLTPELLLRALAGDEQATREYCGSYKLVQASDGLVMYRTKVVQGNWKEITEYAGHSVYDSEGYLKSIFWSLPRI